MTSLVGSVAGEGGAWTKQAEAALAALESPSSPCYALRSAAAAAGARVERRGDGVVYAMGGSVDFVMQEVLPTVRYLGRLGPKPAALGFALFTERRLMEHLSEDVASAIRSWFDTIRTYEEIALPAFREHPALSAVRVRVKAIKAHAFLLAPFERFVFLDFDSRPCSIHFAAQLFAELRRRRVDALLHNQWEERQSRLDGERHYAIEHNSAIAVFDATTQASRLALESFVAAFGHMRPRRDQPPLMVALRAARRSRNLTHGDISAETFCRRNASKSVSCDAGCLVVHKPQKYDPGHVVFGIGADGTGATDALPRLLATLKIRNTAADDGTTCDPDRAFLPKHHRLLAGDDLGCRVFVGDRVVTEFAALEAQWPRAKFVLTVSSRPGYDELNHNGDAARILDPSRLFVLDLRLARRDDAVWKQFCSFLEVWSSCKTASLSAIAGSWLANRHHERRRGK